MTVTVWLVLWPAGLMTVSVLPAWGYPADDRFPGLLVSGTAWAVYALALSPVVGAWFAGHQSRPLGFVRRIRPPLAVATAFVVSGTSWVAVALDWVVSGSRCTGTGTGYYGCESFNCRYGDRVAAVELFVVSPALLVAMLVTLRAAPRPRAAVWAAALCYLVAGRLAVFHGLGDLVVRDCLGL